MAANAASAASVPVCGAASLVRATLRWVAAPALAERPFPPYPREIRAPTCGKMIGGFGRGRHAHRDPQLDRHRADIHAAKGLVRNEGFFEGHKGWMIC